jgi:hypothetical protein
MASDYDVIIESGASHQPLTVLGGSRQGFACRFHERWGDICVGAQRRRGAVGSAPSATAEVAFRGAMVDPLPCRQVYVLGVAVAVPHIRGHEVECPVFN